MPGSLLLIINADDFGLDVATTDAILDVYERGLITSTTAMIYEADSARAAELGSRAGLPVGLHLNLTEPFTGANVPPDVAARQLRVMKRMRLSKYARWFYWPDIAHDMRASVRDQARQFMRPYGKSPTHVDGHHHIQVSANVLLGNALPRGAAVRSSFTYIGGSRGRVNRAVRAGANARIRSRHVTTGGFCSLSDYCADPGGVEAGSGVVRRGSLEVMCHPGFAVDRTLLLSERWEAAVASHVLGSFATLSGHDGGGAT